MLPKSEALRSVRESFPGDIRMQLDQPVAELQAEVDCHANDSTAGNDNEDSQIQAEPRMLLSGGAVDKLFLLDHSHVFTDLQHRLQQLQVLESIFEINKELRGNFDSFNCRLVFQCYSTPEI
jgi:hypothetical protein